ncbi:MAG: hypothetical protein AB1736_07895 [Chloroflexota bacterium]
MVLWFRVRRIDLLLAAIALGALLLVTPLAALRAMPSPAGANVAAACMIALLVPMALSGSCSRSDDRVEAVAVRPTRALDFLLVISAIVASCAVSTLQELIGLTSVGVVAARATLAYGGLLLVAQSLSGWRVAAVLPATYLLAVAIAGRGPDVTHPAWWAWIAAGTGDTGSWLLTGFVDGLGTATYWKRSARLGNNTPG